MSFSLIKEIRGLNSCGRLLDVGCGEGSLMKTLGSDYYSCGIDSSIDVVRRARANNLNVKVYDALKPFPFYEPFDLITAINIIEFVNNPNQLLVNINNSLVMNGHVILKSRSKNLNDLLMDNGFSIVKQNHYLKLSKVHFRMPKLFSNESFITARKVSEL